MSLQTILFWGLGLFVGTLATWLVLREQWWRNLTDEKTALQLDLEKRDGELAEMQRRLKVLNGRLAIAERRHATAIENIAKLEKELSQTQGHRVAAEAQLKEVESYVHTLQGQLDEIKRQREQITQDLHSALEKPHKQIAALQVGLAQKRAQYDSLWTQHDLLSRETAVRDDEIVRLKEVVAELRGELRAVRGRPASDRIDDA